MMDLTTAEQVESEMFMDLNLFSIAESSVELQQLVPLYEQNFNGDFSVIGATGEEQN